MEQSMLFSEAEIPLKEKPNKQQQKKESPSLLRAAKDEIKKLIAEMQKSFWEIFDAPIKNSRRKAVSRKSVDVSVSETPLSLKEEQVFDNSKLSSKDSIKLHESLFFESMEALKARGNAKEKLEILDWIFSPDIIEKSGKTHDGRSCLIRRHAYDIPFSFLNCCRAVGIRNPDDYRAGLVEQMDGEIRAKLERYLRVVNSHN